MSDRFVPRLACLVVIAGLGGTVASSASAQIVWRPPPGPNAPIAAPSADAQPPVAHPVAIIADSITPIPASSPDPTPQETTPDVYDRVWTLMAAWVSWDNEPDASVSANAPRLSEPSPLSSSDDESLAVGPANMDE